VNDQPSEDRVVRFITFAATRDPFLDGIVLDDIGTTIRAYMMTQETGVPHVDVTARRQPTPPPIPVW
jgi:hypothetical protein